MMKTSLTTTTLLSLLATTALAVPTPSSVPGPPTTNNPNRMDPSTWIWLEIPILPGTYNPSLFPPSLSSDTSNPSPPPVTTTTTSSSSSGTDTKKEKRQNYSATCAIWTYFQTGQVDGYCDEVSSFPRLSSLDMKLCLSNNNGVLNWADHGNFVATCDPVDTAACGGNNGIWIEGTSYGACCRTIGGAWTRSTIDLNVGLSNWDGHLVCYNNVGS